MDSMYKNTNYEMFQHGGELIDQGTYGCVFKPPFKCRDEVKRKKDYVSKLSTRGETNREYKNTERIHKIDPMHVFTLPKPKLCQFHEEHLNEIELEKCKVFNKDSYKNYKFLQYKDAGVSLDSIVKYKLLNTESQQHIFFNKFKTIVYGLYQMNKNKFYHMDIKSGNIMVQPDDLTMKYIDFGLSGYMKDIMKQYSIFLSGYFIYPYELILCHPKVFDYVKQTGKISTKDFMDLYNARNNYGRKVIDKHFIKNGSLYTSTLEKELLQKYVKDIQLHSYDDFTRRVIEKVDVFSLGIVLLFSYVYSNKHRLDLKQQDAKSSPLLKSLYILIKGMLEPYYKNRMTAKQVYDYYMKNIIPLVRDVQKKNETIQVQKEKMKRNLKKSMKQSMKKKEMKEPEIDVKRGFMTLLFGKKPGYKTIDKKKTPVKRKLKQMKEKSKKKEIKQTRKRKPCTIGQIRNPKTGRCIQLDGPVAKKYLHKYLHKSVKPKDKTQTKKVIFVFDPNQKRKKKKTYKKPCNEYQIRNPKTGRCIKLDGNVAKKLLQGQ